MATIAPRAVMDDRGSGIDRAPTGRNAGLDAVRLALSGLLGVAEGVMPTRMPPAKPAASASRSLAACSGMCTPYLAQCSRICQVAAC
jgi:hypothetical protein